MAQKKVSPKKEITEKKVKVVRTREDNSVIEKLPSKEVKQVELEEEAAQVVKSTIREIVKEEIEEQPVHLREKTRLKLKYRKIGGGSFRLYGKIIKPNQVFSAYPEDIPEAFSDVVKCLDDEEVQRLVLSSDRQYHVKEALYEIHEQAAGRFYVINGSTRKPLHTNPTSKEEAIKLRDSLNV